MPKINSISNLNFFYWLLRNFYALSILREKVVFLSLLCSRLWIFEPPSLLGHSLQHPSFLKSSLLQFAFFYSLVSLTLVNGPYVLIKKKKKKKKGAWVMGTGLFTSTILQFYIYIPFCLLLLLLFFVCYYYYYYFFRGFFWLCLYLNS